MSQIPGRNFLGPVQSHEAIMNGVPASRRRSRLNVQISGMRIAARSNVPASPLACVLQTPYTATQTMTSAAITREYIAHPGQSGSPEKRLAITIRLATEQAAAIPAIAR